MVYLGCARAPIAPVPTTEPEIEPAPEAPEPTAGGALRIALSASELDLRTRDTLISRWEARPAALLDRVDVLASESIEPAELLLLGEADLAVLRGRSVARVRAAGEFELRRAPGWDRTYALLCDRNERWTHDPNFRRWFAETIDRADLSVRLFGAAASPAFALSPEVVEPRWAPPMIQPFGPTSRPVLDLAYDRRDPRARSIAARLKAALAIEGMELRLVEDVPDEPPELTLIAYQEFDEDRFDSVSRLLPADAEGARFYLKQASNAEGESRRSLVALAEDALLLDARLIPLVRLEAWVAASPRLRGVEPGWTGELALDAVWWAP